MADPTRMPRACQVSAEYIREMAHNQHVREQASPETLEQIARLMDACALQLGEPPGRKAATAFERLGDDS